MLVSKLGDSGFYCQGFGISLECGEGFSGNITEVGARVNISGLQSLEPSYHELIL